MNKGFLISIILVFLLILLTAASLFSGSVDIPHDQVLKAILGQPVEKESWSYIVMESRLPQTVTALLCGACLSASGLLLQTAFGNPLAGPSILGITNGASLGVAVVMLASGGVVGMGAAGQDFHVGGFLAVIIGAFLGALAVIMLLFAFSNLIKSSLMLLIVGIMVGYLTTSVVSLLNFLSNADNVHSYVMWGMGSFSDVTRQQLPWFAGACVFGLLCAILLVKPLNALLLGNAYAANLGVNIRLVRNLLLLTTGLLTAIATAFCGPVGFIGLAVPHIARLISGTENHKSLLPVTILTGSVIALLCNIASTLPDNLIIPLNAITPIFGAPVILYIICTQRKG